MEQLQICYDFRFSLQVQTKKGKIWKKHSQPALGFSYNDAVWDAYFNLRKRGHIIIRVNSVEVTGIAFVHNKKHETEPLKLTEHMPEIPQDLNQEVTKLPQNKIS